MEGDITPPLSVQNKNGGPQRFDRFVVGLFLIGLLAGTFFSQGLPYWDVDYELGFKLVHNQSLPQLLWQCLSPVSADAVNWGFLDRPFQGISYKVAYWIAGYSSWPIVLFRILCYAGLGVIIYLWALRLSGNNNTRTKIACAAAVVFFITCPGPVAALVWIADFSVVAELAFLILTYILWNAVENTNSQWTALSLGDPERRRWLIKWAGLSLAVYLSYRTKADLKLIPFIVTAYVILFRRRQLKLFAVPLALMFLLAVPWGSAAFAKPPAFLPGSGANSVGYMWQPASLSHLLEFVWSSTPQSFSGSLKHSPMSLAGLLGPFLLIGVVAFLLWKWRFRPIAAAALSRKASFRAGVFIVIWLGGMLLAMSALPRINPFFQVRYTILILIPVCILLGYLFGVFANSQLAMPRWAALLAILLFVAQTSIGVYRSISYRSELGRVMIAVDRAYDFVNTAYPDMELALMPGFLPYAYRPAASPAIENRDALREPSDLSAHHTPGKTIVLSWQDASTPELQLVKKFNGCQGSLFDLLVSCPSGLEISLMRFTGAAGVSTNEPRTAEDFLNLSLQYCRAGKNHECITAAQNALTLRPGYAEAYNNIAAAYEAMEMWDEAIRAAQEALRLKPDFQLARNNLEWSLAQKRKQQGAH